MASKSLAKVPKGNNAEIGVTKIITLGRKKLLVAEFTSEMKIPDGPYEVQRITVTRRKKDMESEDELEFICVTKIFDCFVKDFKGCVVRTAPK